jgi:hypothetical protein
MWTVSMGVRSSLGLELVLDVLPRLLDGGRSRRPRPDRHELAQVLPGTARVEFRLRRRRLQHQGGDDEGMRHERFSLVT